MFRAFFVKTRSLGTLQSASKNRISSIPRSGLGRYSTSSNTSKKHTFGKFINDFIDAKPAPAAVWSTIIVGVGGWLIAGLSLGSSVLNNVKTSRVEQGLARFKKEVDGETGSITTLRTATARIEQNLSRIKNIGKITLELGLMNSFPDQKLDRERLDVIMEVYRGLKDEGSLRKLCPQATINAMERFISALEKRAEEERVGKASRVANIKYKDQSS